MKTFLLSFCAAFLALAFSIKVNAQVPTITSFSPDSGPIGTTVVITGTNFSPIAENNIVYTGGVKAVVTAATTTSLNITAPAEATDIDQLISVTVNGLTAYSHTPFIVTFPGCNTSSSSNTNSVNGVVTVIADIDGDGKGDIITGSFNNGSVSIRRNLSGGAYAPGVVFPTGTPTGRRNSVTTGDLDGDGKLDLAVVTTDSRIDSCTISLFRNTSSIGNISFAPKLDLIIKNSTRNVAIGDLNGDGKPDLAIHNPSNRISSPLVPTGTASVYLNISTVGTLAFANKVDFPTHGNFSDAYIADFDVDGKQDLAFLDYLYYSVSILRNTSIGGSLSFAVGSRVSLGSSPNSLGIVDLDRDGKPDLVPFGGFISQYSFSVFRNTSTPGTISFANTPYGGGGLYTQVPRIGDLNGDGKPELVSVSMTGDDCSDDSTLTTILENTSIAGSLSFRNRKTISTPGCFSSRGLDSAVSALCSPCSSGSLPTFVNNGTIVLDATCANNDGNISIIPTSGTAPFMYSKDGGATYVAGPNSGSGFQNLSAGIYKLRLKDANGCESAIVEREVKRICSTTCTPPTFVNNNLIVLDATCANNDGGLSIIPTSGTAPFMYSKDGGATYVAGPNSGSGFQNLSAGIYRLRLKDANGCESAVIEREVKRNCAPACTPPTFVNNALIVLEPSCANNDGNISIIPTSGTAPFMYSRDGGATYVAGPNTGSGFTGLAAGTYRLRLKDATGCESAIVEKTLRRNGGNACSSNDMVMSNTIDRFLATQVAVIKIYPNPNRGQFKIQLQKTTSPKVEVTVTDAKGTLIQKRSLNLTQATTVDFDLKGKTPGLYFIKVVSGSKSEVTKVLIQ